jgi:hypothetical protein
MNAFEAYGIVYGAALGLLAIGTIGGTVFLKMVLK